MTALFVKFALLGPDLTLSRDVRLTIDQGRLVEVRSDSVPSPADHDLGDLLLCPGLINAHTHLELSGLQRDPTPPDSFVDWLISLASRQPNNNPHHDAIIHAATLKGIDQCLHFGMTCVGDISQHAHLTRPVLARSPLRAISFGEVLGMMKLQHRFDQTFARVSAPQAQPTASYQTGLSPHAPYTVSMEGYRQIIHLARSTQQPLCTHLAETSQERLFLLSHAGDFRRLWDNLGMWQEHDAPGVGPIEFARDVGLLDQDPLLAHVNDINDGELALLARYNASVVWCPRTHDYFGHPQTLGPHRWRDMLKLGINVCVGTDSVASAGDLDLLADLRLLYRQGQGDPTELLHLVTTRAAQALGRADLGTIGPGKRADLSAFAVDVRHPLESLLSAATQCRGVWVAGEKI